MSDIGHNGPPPLSDGWIARHRSVRDHWLVGHGIHVKPADPARKRCKTQGEAWEDLLMECRYDGGAINNGGKRMELRRGEMLGAVSWLASRWNWTPKTVRRFLDQLENEKMIALVRPQSETGNQKGRQANVITVCNYDKYQSQTMMEGQPERPTKGNQRATRGQPEGNIYKDNKGTKEQGNKEVSEGEPALAAAAAPPAVEALAAFQAYNELAQRIGLPMAHTLTPARRKSLQARIREHGGMEAWTLALSNVERSAFLRGNNAKGWRCDFDFLLQASRFCKVIDGTYGNGAHGETLTPETKAERFKRHLETLEDKGKI